MVIGLWSKHIHRSAIHLYRTTLQRSDLVKPDGRFIFSKAHVERVCKRIGDRLICFTADNAGLTLTPKYARHLYNVSVHDKGTFTAGRMEYLMVALPFALRDLIFKEVQEINAQIDEAPVGSLLHGLDPVIDPSSDIICVINHFVSVFTMGRRYDTCAATLPVLAERIRALQEILLEVMPEKSGII